jgi:hypothetical protein
MTALTAHVKPGLADIPDHRSWKQGSRLLDLI